MPQFTYIAQTLDGKPENGSIDSLDAETARETLRKRGLLVEEVMPASIEEPLYAPLSDTLRLYAGWLLAWYALVYALGSYIMLKHLPFNVPFLDGLFLSPLVLDFAFGTFCFLTLSSVHRLLGRGTGIGIVLALVWLGLMTGFVLYI